MFHGTFLGSIFPTFKAVVVFTVILAFPHFQGSGGLFGLLALVLCHLYATFGILAFIGNLLGLSVLSPLLCSLAFDLVSFPVLAIPVLALWHWGVY